MEGVGLTSLWVAAMRAVESEREDGLIHDPFARALAGDEGFAVLRRSERGPSVKVPTLPVRTRYYDEEIERSIEAGIRQLVILASGMDARAYRMSFPTGAIVFEIDQPAVLSYKSTKLADATPRCRRVAIPLDLRDDWPTALSGAGFDACARTIWLVEGLLPYLHEPDVAPFLARIDALSSSGSVLLCDVIGRSALDSPYMKSRLAFVEKLGAPWRFGTDEPESLLTPLGWDVDAQPFGTIGHRYGRWPFPPFARGTPGVPQSFLVNAKKH